MKKKFTLIALAFLSVMAFAYQATRAAGDPIVLYSWESPDGEVVESGGTITYENGDGDRLNYKQTFKISEESTVNYYTICLNGKKANIDDATASANAGHMLITLDEELAEGDEIAITAFTNKTSSSKSSAWVVFEKGDAIDSGDFTDESNIGLDNTKVPETKTITVAAGNAGSKTIKLTRGSTSTNLYITKLVISRTSTAHEHTPASAVIENEIPATCTAVGSYDEVVYCSECSEELSRETKTIPPPGHMYDGKGICERCGEVMPSSDAVTVDFTDNGYENGEKMTSPVTENGVTVEFGNGTNTSNGPAWYNTGNAVRFYAGNTMTVSAEKKIKKIVITFGTGDGSNDITTDVETYTDGTWEGESNSVTFTIDGTKGHRRIAKLDVTLDEGGSTEHEHVSILDEAQSKEPTCTESGLTIMKCSICGEVLSSETVEPLGHDFEKYTEYSKEPTCTESGREYIACLRCGEILSDTEIPALGHDFNSEGVCSRCGEAMSSTELEVPGTVIWSSDEAADIDWSVGKSVIIPAENFASVKVGDKINIGILGAPADASSSNWDYQVALQVPTTDGWKDIESSETLKQKNNYVHSFIITGDMLRYIKQYGLALNGTKFQVKKVAVESAYSGSDESIWVGELKGNVVINACHFTNANDFTGIKVGDIIRVTKDAVSWVGLNYNDKEYKWQDFPTGSITVANDWVNPIVEITIATEEAANLINTGSTSVVVNNPDATITQIELIKAPVVEPEVVDITVEPADGTDIYEAYAAKVKEVTDAGNVVGNITINLEGSKEYSISSPITANKNVTINGNGATIDASALTAPFIQMATIGEDAELNEKDALVIDGITIKDVTMTGLPYQLIYGNKQKYLMKQLLVENSVIGVNGTAKKTIFDFNGGGNASELIINNSTLWANPSNAQNGGLFSSQSGQGSIQDLGSDKQLFAITNSTIYNIAYGSTTNSQRRNNTAGMEFKVENSVIVNSGKSGQFVVGLNGGSANSAQTYTISNNVFNFDGADISAAEEAKVKEKIADAALNSIEGVVTFTDTANGDFSGTVLLSPSATEPSALGDPRWTLTYGKALAINITESEGGKVTASPSAAAEGMTVTLTATPDEGYELESLTVKDGADKEVTVGEDNTFTMPATDVTVTATFKKLPVDVNITVESGKDIAAAVEAAADGAPTKSITVTLAENGKYTIGKSLTSPGNVTINGAEGAVIDASGLTAPLVTLSGTTEQAKNADGSDNANYKAVEDVTIKDVTITGLTQSVVKDDQKTLVGSITIDNSVIEFSGSKNIFDFNGKGYPAAIKVNNSTLWSATSHTGYFLQASGRVKDLDSDQAAFKETIEITNSTLVNISVNKQLNNLQGKGQKSLAFTLTNSILVNTGSSTGNEVRGWLGGQNSTNPTVVYENNTYWSAAAGGEAVAGWTDASKQGSDQSETALTSDPEFKDAANGDFTVGESTEQAELETGDPRWLTEYAGGEGDATDLLAEIEEAKKLLGYDFAYYDENTDDPGKALVDAIRSAEDVAESAASQKKIDKAIETLKEAELTYCNTVLENEIAESESLLALAEEDDELVKSLAEAVETAKGVLADDTSVPANKLAWANLLDKYQKDWLTAQLIGKVDEANSLLGTEEPKNETGKALKEAADAGQAELDNPVNTSESLAGAYTDLVAALDAYKADPTAIRGIEANDTDDAPVYNMGGQRVSSHAKGIVIKNGKKIIRK